MANKDINIAVKAKNETASGIQSAIGSLKSLDNQVTAVSKTFQALGKLTVIAGLGTAIKKAGSFALDAANEFGIAERTLLQLKTAVGGSEERVESLTALIEDLSGSTLESKDSLEKIVSELATFGRSDTEIEKITRATTILANVTGDSLESAFTKLNGTYTGTVGKLEKMDTAFGALTKQQLENGGAIDLVISKYGTVSDAMSGGWSQSVKNLKDSWEDFSESMGSSVARVFNPLLITVTDIVKQMTEMVENSERAREILSKSEALRTKEDRVFLGEKRLTEIDFKKRAMQSDGTDISDAYGELVEEERDLRRELKELSEAIAQERRALAAQKKATGGSTSTNPSTTAANNDQTMYSPGATDVTKPEDVLLKNILTPPEYPQMYEAGATDVAGPPEDNLLKNIIKAQGAIGKLQESAFGFGDAWSGALDTIAGRFQSWTAFAAGLMTTLADGVSNGLMSVGAALVNGQNGWEAFGSAALSAISEVLKGLGSQLAAMAAIELIKGNFAGAALAAAGSAAAYISAGAVGASAGSSSDSTNSSSTLSSNTYSPGGYTGPENVTINNYLNGTFYSEADLERRLYQISWNAVNDKQFGFATAY